jgi:hypothetical protein
MVDAKAGSITKTRRENPCKVSGVPTIRIDTEDVREALSGLCEGVRAAFTVSTESSETACALHLKIPNVVLTSPEQFARESMQRVRRNREQAEHAAHTNFVEHSFHALG